MTKIELVNGWTKEKLIAKIKEHVPEGGAFAKHSCHYALGVNYPGKGRCAIGACLPGTPNKDAWFGHGDGVYSLLVDFPHLWEHMPFMDIEDLQSFQNSHDSSCMAGDVTNKVVAWIEEHVE